MSQPIGEAFGYGNKSLQVYGSPGEPWFLNNQACGILEHSNPRQAASSLDPDERRVSRIVTPFGGPQQATFINESGLYTLTMKSRKPEAK